MTSGLRTERIAVLGETWEGWLCAAFLARLLGRMTQVVVVPTPQDAGAPPALASLPSMRGLHDAMGLDEHDLARACEGTFRLGTLHEREAGRSFVVPFGAPGPSLEGAAFHQHWLRLKVQGDEGGFEPHWLGAVLARSGRFLPQAEVEGLPLPEYGLHLSGAAYAKFMQRAALHYGAKRAARLAQALPGNDDRIDALRLEDGADLRADLYLDCTGTAPDAAAGWHDAGAAPALAWSEDSTQPNLSATRMRLEEDAEDILIPLAGRSIRLRSGGPGGEGRLGWQARSWRGNLVAIGAAACRLPPLEMPQMRIAQIGIEALRGLLPNGADQRVEREEFNRVTSEAYARLADFQRLHRILAGRAAQPAPDDPLARKIEQFESRGRVVTYDGESFDQDSHLAVMLGHGLMPRRYDPLTETVPAGEARSRLKQHRRAVLRAAETAQDQGEVARILHAPRRRSAGGGR
ncbi:tryptophan 7-halogenase [Parvularcula oceani]|uniref:tryptophan 7-halogenase n=1 Tax=Parvularcula oceani TaxID=1247963 RepID=UPI0012DBFC91|nr:tryptophan 7-halogenase [Parvularcula oceani]